MKTKIIAAAALLLAAAGAFCGRRYYTTTYLPQKRLDDAVKKQEEIIAGIRPDVRALAAASGETPADPLEYCENVNDDIVGWITIPDTNIDLPIVQGEDNDFYLHNGVDGQYNYELGCPFLDYRCSRDLSGLNSIVYAHNMEGRQMFADIPLFRDEAFLEAHSSGVLTLKDGQHNVRFFAYLSPLSTSPLYNTVFVSESERREYTDFLFRSADHTSFFTAEELSGREELRLLLLSTCTFETDESRGVLAGIIE
ncbi:MAG: class B sortase [Ruminococcus sp.]|uniref:class B sortase n=1 Tax=Ruminococcus sp. TaxID=41978 RepID=UPI0025FC388F|nr:class B sortase [Ruminococcus sp.]MCR5600164.1 class B sortase [Ruminococcus sp.]